MAQEWQIKESEHKVLLFNSSQFVDWVTKINPQIAGKVQKIKCNAQLDGALHFILYT